jgi:hypothetical protein
VELKDFVADALFQILEGVREACSRNTIGTTSPAFKIGDQDVEWNKYVKDVEFDIAVEITNKITGSGNVGGKVITILNLDAKGEVSHASSKLNKIKFAVPILYPAKVIAINILGTNNSIGDQQADE